MSNTKPIYTVKEKKAIIKEYIEILTVSFTNNYNYTKNSRRLSCFSILNTTCTLTSGKAYKTVEIELYASGKTLYHNKNSSDANTELCKILKVKSIDEIYDILLNKFISEQGILYHTVMSDYLLNRQEKNC